LRLSVKHTPIGAFHAVLPSHDGQMNFYDAKALLRPKLNYVCVSAAIAP